MIDVTVEDSAGWWLQRLSKVYFDDKRINHLKDLDDWFRGDPPLPFLVSSSAKEATRAFHRNVRSNFCALIPEAMRSRMTPMGIQTSSDDDSTGDKEAWRIWRRARMSLIQADVHRTMLRFGLAYALVSPVDDLTGVPVVTAEDPRTVVSEQDPMQPWRTIAGLKMFRDTIAGYDFAYLYRPGRLDVARRKLPPNTLPGSPTRFSAKTWEIDDQRSRDLPDDLMPLVKFANLDELAEFEPHLDLLGRINYLVLQLMQTATLQAFKQRAVIGVPDQTTDGKKIDYNSIFSAAADSMWALPADAKLWESGQADLQGLLNAIKAAIRDLAAVSQTPLSMFAPEGENQSAEGAASAKENLLFKITDRIDRITPCWSQVMQACFLWMAEILEGEEHDKFVKMADLNGIDVLWAPAFKSSLSEQASALSQARDGEVPWRSRMIKFGGFSPEKVDDMAVEREDDQLFSQRVANAKAAAAQPLSTSPQPTPEPEAVGAAA